MGEELYQLVWEPLEKHLSGIKKISFPSGKLYGIAFMHCLFYRENYCRINELRQYVGTRQIAFRSAGKQESRPQSIALFGNASLPWTAPPLPKHLQQPLTVMMWF